MRHVAGLVVLAAMLGMSGCRSAEPTTDSIFAGIDVFGDYNAKLSPRSGPDAYAMAEGRNSSGAPLSQTFGPDGGLSQVGDATQPGPGEYALNFENADVKDVIRAVLTDALKISYTLNGDVSGPITISAARPVSRSELLATLESSLSSFGFSMVKNGDGYRIGPNGLGGGAVERGRRTSAGFGVSIVPLRFVPAETMLQLLSGFVVEDANLRIGKSGNSIIVRGSGPQRAEAVQAIVSFDADFMEDQSVSIFRLTQARPEAVIPELERIFNASGENSLIQFKPMNRLRGIMAISKNGGLLRRAETWVRRLDQESADAGRNVIVYEAKYRKATELARVVSNLFNGAGSGSDAAAPRQAMPASDASYEGDGDGEGGGTDGQADGADARIASAFDDPSAGNGAEGGTGDAGPNVVDLTQNTGSTGQDVRVSADPSNNSVVIYADSDRAAQILATLRRLDATQAQVAINVTIAEVRLTNQLKYGVQYFVNSQRLGLGDDNGSISLVDTASSVLKSQIPGLNVVLGSSANPDVIISALDVIGDVEVLSSPSLVVLENQTASLQVGDEVPITTRQSQSTDSALAPIINQVEFKNTGILLNVTPRIGQNDAVTMEIAQEISNVTQGANTLTPTISKRRVQSQISVSNGQTVLLAGLISASRSNGRSGVPGFGGVPVLRDIFGSTDKGNGRTELIVLIRPVVIRTDQDAANVAASLRATMDVLGGRRAPVK